MFVDDEPLVLQGLRRMLHPLRHEWEMVFMESGPQALASIDRSPVDVVVSDMRMPGMSGAEFLAEVMKRHPETIRLILTGHAEQDLILKCVGTTHQCLSKPCDPETLRKTVQRAALLGGALRNESIKKLATRMDRLPTIPTLYSELIEKLQSPDAMLDDLAAIVQRDIGMTAKILKLVNSAYFGLSRRISSPTEAVSYLGIETIKSLALSLHAFSQYQVTRSGGLSLEDVWNHSLLVGEGARALARAEGLGRREQDEAFVSGLLHDTGKIVLACNYPAEYGEALQLAATGGMGLLAAERQVFSCTHADLGGYLLGLWGLPPPVVEAISFHHSPADAMAEGLAPVVLVHAADAFVNAAAPPGRSPALGAKEPDQAFLTQFGLAGRIESWRSAMPVATATPGRNPSSEER